MSLLLLATHDVPGCVFLLDKVNRATDGSASVAGTKGRIGRRGCVCVCGRGSSSGRGGRGRGSGLADEGWAVVVVTKGLYWGLCILLSAHGLAMDGCAYDALGCHASEVEGCAGPASRWLCGVVEDAECVDGHVGGEGCVKVLVGSDTDGIEGEPVVAVLAVVGREALEHEGGALEHADVHVAVFSDSAGGAVHASAADLVHSGGCGLV
jgi:hypothetical protein